MMARTGRRPIEFDITESGCYECTSHKATRINSNGQKNTVYNDGSRNWLLHRYIFTECHGPIPEGHVIRHKCDNPQCFNPEHLESGTQKENMSDMIGRGRNKCGPRKIDEAIALQIHDLLNSKLFTQKQIGEFYGIASTTVQDIHRGKTWRLEDLERRTQSERGELQCQ